MAQLAEQLMPTAEIHSLNPFIGKLDLLSTVIKPVLVKTKEAGNGPLKKQFATAPRFSKQKPWTILY